MRPYFGSWCEARARGQTYLFLLEPVVKTFPLVGEQSVSKSTYTICQNFFPTEIQESKDGSVTAVEPDKSEKGDCSDCLAQVQKIGSHDRRKRAYDAGYAKGFEEGKKLVDTNLKATNDALQNRIVEVLGETNTTATNQLIATQTAATLICFTTFTCDEMMFHNFHLYLNHYVIEAMLLFMGIFLATR